MPFVVKHQTAVRVNWSLIDSIPETLTKWERFFSGYGHTRKEVIQILSEKSDIPLDDLLLRKEVYYKNDKLETSLHYIDRDNACLIIDLQLNPRSNTLVKRIIIGSLACAIVSPHYYIEKVQ